MLEPPTQPPSDPSTPPSAITVQLQPYHGPLGASPTEEGKRFGQRVIDTLAPICGELRDAGLNRLQLYTALMTTTREVLARTIHARMGMSSKPPSIGPSHPTWARQADFALRWSLEGLASDAVAKGWTYPEALAVFWDFVPQALVAMPAPPPSAEPEGELVARTTATFKVGNRLPS